MSDATTDEPTIGEVGRTVARIETALGEFRDEMRRDYVRQDVHDRERETDALIHQRTDKRLELLEVGLKAHTDSHAATWRSWVQPIALALLTAVSVMAATYLLTGGPK